MRLLRAFVSSTLYLGENLSMPSPNSQGGGRTTTMLLGLRSDLLACPLVSSSAAVRPSKFLLASFGRLRSSALHSYSHVPRQPTFPVPSPTSRTTSSYLLLPPACPKTPVSHCCPRSTRPVPSVDVVRDKRDNKSEKKKRGD